MALCLLATWTSVKAGMTVGARRQGEGGRGERQEAEEWQKMCAIQDIFRDCCVFGHLFLNISIFFFLWKRVSYCVPRLCSIFFFEAQCTCCESAFSGFSFCVCPLYETQFIWVAQGTFYCMLSLPTFETFFFSLNVLYLTKLHSKYNFIRMTSSH